MDSVRTEPSFKRRLLMEERTDTQEKGPRSFPLDWLCPVYLLVCKADTEKPRENHFLSPCALEMVICTNTLVCTLLTWGSGQASLA